MATAGEREKREQIRRIRQEIADLRKLLATGNLDPLQEAALEEKIAELEGKLKIMQGAKQAGSKGSGPPWL